MKKIILLSKLVFFASFVLSQDTVRLKHTNYIQYIVKQKNIPF